MPITWASGTTRSAGPRFGIQASYDNTANAGPNTGLLWHAINSKIPTSGFKSNLFLYNPRLGAAYDVFGTGRTVVRAGFGTYRYQVSGNDAGAAMNGPLGSFSYGTGNEGINGFYGYGIAGGVICVTPDSSGLANNCAANGTRQLKVPSGVNQNHADVRANKQGDDKLPYADTYSFGVAQALPSHTVAEISYVGSLGRNQFLNGGNGHIQDLNPVAYGAFFTPDPTTATYWNTASDCGELRRTPARARTRTTGVR